MKVTGRINLFIENVKKDDGTFWQKYTGTISHKHEDGSYTNASIRLVFNKEEFPEAKMKNLKAEKTYQLEVEDGWLDCKAFVRAENKQGREIYIFINKAKLVNEKTIQNKNELPF